MRVCWARNPIPRVGARGGVSDAELAEALFQSLGLFQAAKPWVEAWGESCLHSGQPWAKIGEFQRHENLRKSQFDNEGHAVWGEAVTHPRSPRRLAAEPGLELDLGTHCPGAQWLRSGHWGSRPGPQGQGPLGPVSSI